MKGAVIVFSPVSLRDTFILLREIRALREAKREEEAVEHTIQLQLELHPEVSEEKDDAT